MADQQNPIQNDNTTTPVTPVTSEDLLGDINLDIPAAPASTDPAKDISEIGDMLVEQSVNNTQSKAETIPATPAPAPTDPTQIDLGDINLPANDQPVMPAPAPAIDTSAFSVDVATAPTLPDAPTGTMFKSEPGAEESITVTAPEPVAEPALGTPATMPAPEESTAVENNIAPVVNTEPVIDTPAATPMEESAVAPAEPVEIAPAMPTEISTPAISEVTAEPAKIEVPLPVEQTDTMIDSLVANEQTQVTTDVKVDDTAFDLDSLTSDLTPKGNEEVAPVMNPVEETAPATETVAAPAEVIPAVASVTLPQATLVQPVAHGSAKKKAFAMVAAFLMLLVVGGFVFKTMMPEESSKLFASILGETTTEQSLETPEVATETTSDIDALVDESTNNVDDTSALTDGESTIEAPAETTEETMPENTTGPESAITTLSLGQAQTTVSLIVNNSKKLLALAIKYEEKPASQMLYKVFKDSSALAEALANTSDISTIPDIESQIDDMQKTLTQATIIVNVAGSKHAESQ